MACELCWHLRHALEMIAAPLNERKTGRCSSSRVSSFFLAFIVEDKPAIDAGALHACDKQFFCVVYRN